MSKEGSPVDDVYQIKGIELDFLFTQFEKRMEDARYSFVSIGKGIVFLFNLAFGITFASIGYSFTEGADQNFFLWTSFYFIVIAGFVFFKGLRLSRISPLGLDPRLMEIQKEFCLQEISDLKHGTIDIFKDRLVKMESETIKLTKIYYYSVGLFVLYPAMTVLAWILLGYLGISLIQKPLEVLPVLYHL